MNCHHVSIPIQKGSEELVALQVFGPKCAHLDTPNVWCAVGMPIEPMNNPLGVSPSKGNQGTTRGKEKIF